MSPPVAGPVAPAPPPPSAGPPPPERPALIRGRLAVDTEAMSQQEVDEYLAAVEEPKRTTLEALRRTILRIVPDAEQCISYGMPAFKLDGKVVAGFAAFKRHLSYFPHSGSVLPELTDELSGYTTTKGTLQFPVDQPLPQPLVEKLIAVRRRQLAAG